MREHGITSRHVLITLTTLSMSTSSAPHWRAPDTPTHAHVCSRCARLVHNPVWLLGVAGRCRRVSRSPPTCCAFSSACSTSRAPPPIRTSTTRPPSRWCVTRARAPPPRHLSSPSATGEIKLIAIVEYVQLGLLTAFEYQHRYFVVSSSYPVTSLVTYKTQS